MNLADQASYRFVVHMMTKTQRKAELKKITKYLEVLS